MNISYSAVGFNFAKDQTDLIQKKMQRIKYADDLIVDCILKVKGDKKFEFDANVNFRWGANAHVKSDDYEFAAGLNKLMDVLDNKIKKEKDKIQQKNK